MVRIKKNSNPLTKTFETLKANKYYEGLNVIMKREELLGQNNRRLCNLITTNHFSKCLLFRIVAGKLPAS